MLAAFDMTAFLREVLTTMGLGPKINDIVKEVPQLNEMAQQAGMPGPEGMPGNAQGLLQLVGGGAPSGPQSGMMGQ
jgi:hypothetical protein